MVGNASVYGGVAGRLPCQCTDIPHYWFAVCDSATDGMDRRIVVKCIGGIVLRQIPLCGGHGVAALADRQVSRAPEHPSIANPLFRPCFNHTTPTRNH